jgi:hypothetical protein
MGTYPHSIPATEAMYACLIEQRASDVYEDTTEPISYKSSLAAQADNDLGISISIISFDCEL